MSWNSKCLTHFWVIYSNSNQKFDNFFSVFEILLRISEGKPWKETLLQVLPQRKFNQNGKRKHNDSGSQVDNDEKTLSKDEKSEEKKSNLDLESNDDAALTSWLRNVVKFKKCEWLKIKTKIVFLIYFGIYIKINMKTLFVTESYQNHFDWISCVTTDCLIVKFAYRWNVS